MKKLQILTLTILLTSAFFTACSLKLGESPSAESTSEKKDAKKTEKVQKKDKKMTREKITESATKILEGMGETITTGRVVGSSNIYSVAEATSVDQAGVKSKMKVLVGMDVSDHYVMIVGCDEKDYEAKKNTIDAVWGSFEMWSGVR